MKTIWTKGLDKDASSEMKLHYNGGVQLRKRLSVLLAEKVQSKRKEMLKDTHYENSNWAYLQSDAVGYQRALEEIADLLI